MSFFIISFVICFFINMVVSFVISAIFPNFYLAQIISSLVIAFIFAILLSPDKKRCFITREFWQRFLSSAIILLLIDCFSFLIF